MDMYHGNFDIEDRLSERSPMRHVEIRGSRIAFAAAPGQPARIALTLDGDCLNFVSMDPSINRIWLRVCADKDEHVWGGGEQMSYFDLRGRRFPLWTSEPGVGRDKTTEITFKADVSGKAGGDYYHTNYPQPTYLSSAHYALHVETTAYSVFDFRDERVPRNRDLGGAGADRAVCGGILSSTLVRQLSQRFGRQPPLARLGL